MKFDGIVAVRYGKDFGANLLPSPTLKEFRKLTDIWRTYERMSNGMFLFLTEFSSVQVNN